MPLAVLRFCYHDHLETELDVTILYLLPASYFNLNFEFKLQLQLEVQVPVATAVALPGRVSRL